MERRIPANRAVSLDTSRLHFAPPPPGAGPAPVIRMRGRGGSAGGRPFSVDVAEGLPPSRRLYERRLQTASVAFSPPASARHHGSRGPAWYEGADWSLNRAASEHQLLRNTGGMSGRLDSGAPTTRRSIPSLRPSPIQDEEEDWDAKPKLQHRKTEGAAGESTIVSFLNSPSAAKAKASTPAGEKEPGRASIFRRLRLTRSAQPEASSPQSPLQAMPTEGSGIGDVAEGRLRLLVAHHDVVSLGAAFGLAAEAALLDPSRPTGASQAQSPGEEDGGDGKANALLQSCPAFRNELGGEPRRRLALVQSAARPVDFDPPTPECLQTWSREASAMEAGVLENLGLVYLGGRLCAQRQEQNVIEAADHGAFYYRHCFTGKAHYNWVGSEEGVGPFAVSVVREGEDLLRLIIRLGERAPLRLALPEASLSDSTIAAWKEAPAALEPTRALLREVLELCGFGLALSGLRAAVAGPKTEELLLRLDEQPIYTKYKVGVLYCKAGQSTEEQMYNNETGGPAFDDFLDFLGQRITLKGFEGYRGGLDTKGGTQGRESIYTLHQQHEMMFHVSTFLPFTPSNTQQLCRKRHIGNDMVTLVFQEPGAAPFSPLSVRSHFQHVFIIVRALESTPPTYQVAVSRAKDVPVFGPALPASAVFTKSAEFRDFLLTKIINAENAVHRSEKFAAMGARTRRELLRDMAENHAAPSHSDSAARIANRFLGSASAKRLKGIGASPAVLDGRLRGALGWEVTVVDASMDTSVHCVLGLSADSLVLLEKPSGVVLFATSTHSIVGWTPIGDSLKLYYDHGSMLLFRLGEGREADLAMLLRRLSSVSKGCETSELLLRRGHGGPGFHLQEEGVITDVEMYGSAWTSGLRQGSRIVEIAHQAVVVLSLDDMEDLLNATAAVRVLVIPPDEDGSPRRGCEDPHCSAVSGRSDNIGDSVELLPPPFPPGTSRQPPPTYEEAARRLSASRSQVSPAGRVTDQGYESGTTASWGPPLPPPTASSVSSEDPWTPVPRTDTLSSSGSASSEMSADGPASSSRPKRRPQDLKKRDKGAPPLPPRTYRRESVEDQLRALGVDRLLLARAQSDERISTPAALEPLQSVSARPVFMDSEGPGSGDWAAVVAAAADVLRRSDGEGQLRLDAALQRVSALEAKAARLEAEFERERRGRQELDAQIATLRQDNRRLAEAKRGAESELSQFTQWVCRAADPTGPPK